MAKLGRRTMLRGLGGVAVALPFLDVMKPARTAAQVPRRYVQLHSPLGFSPGQWYTPDGADGFLLTDFCAPLQAHADDILIVRGMRGWNGAQGHHTGVGAVFSGQDEGNGYGISLDQQIANMLDARPFKSLLFGWFTSDTASKPGETHTMFAGADQPITPEKDPRVMFTTLFGGGTSTGGEAMAETHKRRQSVLDLVLDDFHDVQIGLSAADRTRLSDHAEFLRSIEMNLSNMGPSCGVLDPADYDITVDGAEGARLSRAQLDLMALALACDLTQVTALQWSYSVGGPNYPWLESRMPGMSSQSRHGWTHEPETGNWDIGLPFFREQEKWYMEEVGYFVDQLKRLEVFDNTLVLWGTNEGRGQHGDDEQGRNDRTYMMLGSLGGHYNTGRVVDVQVQGWVPPESRQDYGPCLLLDVAQAYGYTESTFGNAYRCSGGPTPNLTAAR